MTTVLQWLMNIESGIFTTTGCLCWCILLSEWFFHSMLVYVERLATIFSNLYYWPAVILSVPWIVNVILSDKSILGKVMYLFIAVCSLALLHFYRNRKNKKKRLVKLLARVKEIGNKLVVVPT